MLSVGPDGHNGPSAVSVSSWSLSTAAGLCNLKCHMTKKTPTRRAAGRRRVSKVHAGSPGKRSRAKVAAGSKRTQRSGNGTRPSGPRLVSQPATRPSETRSNAAGGLFDRIRFSFGRQTHNMVGLALAMVGLLTVIAFFGGAGPVGRWLLGVLRFLVGVWVYVLPALFIGIGGVLLLGRHRDDFRRVLVGSALSLGGGVGLFHLIMGGAALAGNSEVVRSAGGAIGSLVAFPLQRLLGFWGAFLVVSMLTALGIMIVTRASIREVMVAAGGLTRYGAGYLRARWVARRAARSANRPPAKRPRAPGARTRRVARRPPKVKAPSVPPDRRSPPGDEVKEEKATVHAEGRMAQVVRLPKRPAPPASPDGDGDHDDTPPPTPHPVDNDEGYSFPPVSLLERGGKERQTREGLDETARQLDNTLRHHKVGARITNVVPGPTVTRFEIELEPGVKVSRVTNLSGDIAYALATPDVRLLAPIPGRSAIGVEVPNRVRRLVTLGDVLSSPEAAKHRHSLAVGLGEDISGKPVLLNLAELPHVLIAGATGAGKSSCINSIVTSILMRTDPEDVRLIMVDPKRVELGQYNGVPHLLTQVISKPKRALEALEWAVSEMDRRYDLLAEAGVRDIDSYRNRLEDGELAEERFDRFPFLVVLIDELNDLMMVAGRAVESAIVRIAQMARAVGIHLVIATQRPSVNVITGVIKANVPSRLAFSVASQTDSRVIIDTIGADKLVGMGDMLVVTALEPRAKRVQGAWVSEAEVSAVVDWVKAQKEVEYRRISEEVSVERRANAEELDGEDADLVKRATELVVRSQLGSTSMLQRRLRIGFARAGRIMDILEQKGIVGPSEGSKARTVLVTIEEFENPEGSPV